MVLYLRFDNVRLGQVPDRCSAQIEWRGGWNARNARNAGTRTTPTAPILVCDCRSIWSNIGRGKSPTTQFASASHHHDPSTCFVLVDKSASHLQYVLSKVPHSWLCRIRNYCNYASLIVMTICIFCSGLVVALIVQHFYAYFYAYIYARARIFIFRFLSPCNSST